MRNQRRIGAKKELLQEICSEIYQVTREMMDYWKRFGGLAGSEGHRLLCDSMLEWQISLSESLAKWTDSYSDGDLILAWANLGTLVEGQLRLFLSVYNGDYYAEEITLKDKKGKSISPDILRLEQLRVFFNDRIWMPGNNWNDFIESVQQKRNAIHAYKRRDISTFEDWEFHVSKHLDFVYSINDSLPYLDEHFPDVATKCRVAPRIMEAEVFPKSELL